ncbi:hypothetical protein DPEC_G00318580 [Dallia pectoralis]|uniref:Uncharacterized protein n=1 Tax=Dallia pectoralis TaxID=75939 RepID=A0ACC2F9A0_DALPE|nr:hypothetical protein DPEC_G00318580 [Dallia pectoralis]
MIRMMDGSVSPPESPPASPPVSVWFPIRHRQAIHPAVNVFWSSIASDRFSQSPNQRQEEAELGAGLDIFFLRTQESERHPG